LPVPFDQVLGLSHLSGRGAKTKGGKPPFRALEKNLAKIVKLGKAQSRCTGVEDRQLQMENLLPNETNK